MTRRLFVTGAAGLIGRHLTRKLAEQNYEVVCFDLGEQFARARQWFEALEKTGRVRIVPGTILDRTGLISAMRGADTVFHLAAMLGVRRTEDNRLRCIEINVYGTENVLQAFVANRATHVVFASSSEVYGEPSRNPIHETDETKGKTVYAVSKLAAEELVKGYHQLYDGLDYTIVRFFNTYGAGQVAQFVISRFVKQVLEGRNPVVYGDGTQRRSYGHVDDITSGLIAMIENPVGRNKIYNLGNSTQIYSLRELAQKTIDVLAPGKGIEVEVVGDFAQTDRTREREIFNRFCDTSRIEADLGYKPVISIEEGIRRIAEAGTIDSDWPFHA